jgi:WD40 repeat protein
MIRKELQVHSDWIRALAFSLDGNFIVSGSDDGTMQVLEVDRGTLLSQPIAAHDAGVTALTFAPRQQLLASGAADGDVKIWSAGAWNVLHHLESTNQADITSLAFFDSGERGVLLIRGDEAGRLEVFSVGELHKAESKPVSSVTLGSAIRSISFGASPQMRMMAICESGEVSVFGNPSRLGEPLVDQRLLVEPSAMAIDRSTSIAAILAARGDADDLLVVPLEQERFVEARTTTVSGLTHAPFCVALSPDGNWAVTGGQTGDVELLDLRTRQRLPTSSESAIETGNSMSTRPHSTKLFTSDTSSRVQEWDAITRRAVGAPIRTFENPTPGPTDFSSKSLDDIQTDAQQSVLAARRGSALEIWDIDRRRRLRSFDLPRGGVFALSESGKQVAFLDRSGISVVDIDDAEPGPSVRMNGPDPLLLQFTDNDRSLLAVTSDELVVIELGNMNRRTYGTNSFHSGRSSAASGPGFIALAISDRSPTIFLDGECSQLEASRSVIQLIAAHSNGRDIVGGNSDFIRVWDRPSGKVIGDVPWPDGQEICCIGFTNGCKSLAIISGSFYEGNTLQFLESPTSEPAAGSNELATYREAMSQVRAARSSLAERIAQVGDSVDSVEVFDLEVRSDPRFTGRLRTAALIVVAEVAADRELTRRSAERKRDN